MSLLAALSSAAAQQSVAGPSLPGWPHDSTTTGWSVITGGPTAALSVSSGRLHAGPWSANGYIRHIVNHASRSAGDLTLDATIDFTEPSAYWGVVLNCASTGNDGTRILFATATASDQINDPTPADPTVGRSDNHSTDNVASSAVNAPPAGWGSGTGVVRVEHKVSTGEVRIYLDGTHCWSATTLAPYAAGGFYGFCGDARSGNTRVWDDLVITEGVSF